MSAFIRLSKRTPEEVLDSIHYAAHELDVDRLHQARDAMDLLALIADEQKSPITLHHVAAVADYVARDLEGVLENMVRQEPGH